MNKTTFALKNIGDKVQKSLKSWQTTQFYIRTYLLSKLDNVTADYYIISYPKCGRTWIRIMLQHYIQLLNNTITTFRDPSLLQLNTNEILKFEHGQGNWVPAPKNYKNLRFNTARYTNKPVIFLIRDPRDVVVSSWYHLKYRENIYGEGLSSFIRSEMVGIRKIVHYMNMWMQNSHIPEKFLLISYEDISANTAERFTELLKFLKLPVYPSLVNNTISAASFNNMKKMEKGGSLKEPWMKPGANNLKNSMKIRKGKIGGYKEEMSEADINWVNQVISEELTDDLKALYINR